MNAFSIIYASYDSTLACLPTFQLNNLPACLPACLPVIVTLRACLPACLPVVVTLRACLPAIRLIDPLTVGTLVTSEQSRSGLMDCKAEEVVLKASAMLLQLSL